MLPFKVQFKPGHSPYRQILFAVEKALVCGRLRTGDSFPSVRALSQACRINPNTAHKVVAELIRRGILEVRPGIGTGVAKTRPAESRERTAVFEEDLERLVVEAKRLSIDYDQLVSELREHWENLSDTQTAMKKPKEQQ
ncbi:MAG: GntR family transcriptional regulator [Acidobacteriota bacterium]